MNTKKRLITGFILIGLLSLIFVLDYYFGIHILNVLWTVLSVCIVGELFLSYIKNNFLKKENFLIIFVSIVWGVLFVYSNFIVSKSLWVLLLMILIITVADTSAWFFGKRIKSSFLWEKLSPKKTWAGQISGIVFGTFASILYGLLGSDTFMPQLFWIGMSISLMSQYGDLTASYIKRRMKTKDFSNILPGHGGLLDRFDGYIYVMPVVMFMIRG